MASLLSTFGLILIIGTSLPVYGIPTGDSTIIFKRIRKVYLMRYDIFSPEQTRSWYQRLANDFHLTTHEKVIRRELTFQEGDAFHPWFLEESARNLRRLYFLGNVSIRPDSVDDTSLVVTVTTQDQWTTELGFTSEGGGGAYTVGFSAGEKNFLGRGQRVELSYEKTDLRNLQSILFFDPRFAGSRWNSFLYFQNTSDGDSLILRTIRPLYSIRSKYGFSTALARLRDHLRFFSKGGDPVFYYQRHFIDLEFRFIRSFGNRLKFNPYLVWQYSERFFYGPFHDLSNSGGLADPIVSFTNPDPKRTALGIGFNLFNNRYYEGKYFDNFGNIEDIPLGVQFTVELSGSHQRWNSSLTRWIPQVGLGHLQRLNSRQLLFVSASHLSDFRSDRWETGLTNITFLYYLRWQKRQTLAWRVAYDAIYGVNRSGQLLLGGDNGLRGYGARQFFGNKRIVFNFENRIFSALEILTVGIGGVVFFDAGAAWPQGQKISFNSLGSNVGVGLRFGLLKSFGFRVARLDLAKPLTENRWRISFGSGMLFGLSQ